MAKRSVAEDNTALGQDAAGVSLYPLSLAQKRLWFLEQFTPGTPAHNIALGLRLEGELRVPALRRAVDAVITRHETLRTAFITLQREVFQAASRTAQAEIPVVDLRPVAESNREREAYKAAYAESRRPFDLEHCPLLRLLLLRLRDTEHILLFTTHHLVSDGWSLGLLVEELVAFYEADLDNRNCRLSPLPIQYSDYVAWHRELLGGEEMARQVRYWKKQLAGSTSLLELPADRMRPSEPSFDGAALAVPLPPALVDSLKRLAQREESTLFTLLLAAFHVLLFRYTNQPDISIGISVAGRGHVEVEALIGLFVNTLVIRADMAGNPRFTDLLAQVRNTTLEAQANQDVPFERVVEEVHPQRSSTYNPLFQVMMTTFEEPRRGARFQALKASPYTIEVSTSVFDLAVFVIEAADGTLWWRLQYSTALFDAARIRRMIAHYLILLNGIVQYPERRIGDLALLTPEEREQFSQWNSTAAEYPKSCVHHLVADQAARTPERIAVTCGETQLTYDGLHRHAQSVAVALRCAGVGPGSRVAICLERSVEMVEGVLGVLYAGAAYVPLDPGWPAARLSVMMAEAGATVLLTGRRLAERRTRNVERQVLIEEVLNPRDGVAELDPQDPESLAYVIFTSGSTGKPKGVCVPHRALVNLLCSMQQEPGLDAHDRLLAVTNLCFDISALELFLPLISGAQLVIASQETVMDGARLRDNLRRHAITIMQATPATWQLLIGAGWERGEGELRVLCGGEALPAGLARKLTARTDSVWNLYGPTETTVWSSLSRVQRDGPVTIGRPIRNTQLYVLDSRMQPVPVGVRGELYIGGHGLATGYLNQPELTSDKFVPNSFDPGGGRLYRTGDEARYRADGEIEYLGRMDLQIKIRGFRIELGEIESVVLQQPGIRQAAAMVREDRSGDRRLVCYVMPEPGAAVSASDVRVALRDRLPDFMVPAVVVLDSWPLTARGKIDFARLPAESVDERIAGGKPHNRIERRLLTICQEVLGLDGIGITDNFFDLGGHSLLVMELLAQIERAFGKRLPVAAIFKAQTVEQMAAAIQEQSWKPGLSLVPVQPHGDRLPLFIIPLADGHAFAYLDLARSLGSGQPVYVLESAAFSGDGKPLELVEDIARHFLQEIRTVQPKGPYRLAGFCMGGIVAFEMARQLIDAGEEAPLLILIETWHPKSIPEVRGGAPHVLRPFLFFVRGAMRHLRALLSLPPRQAGRYFRAKSGILKEMLLYRDVYRGDRYKRNHDLVFEANYRAGSRYIPGPYAGRIVHIVAGNLKVDRAIDTRLVWCDLAAGGCEMVGTSAARMWDLLKQPEVKELAERLTERLTEFEARAAETSTL
ncbi:MAG TPA: amino acid adenylation domain-containing protein [Bryobacteraceae bacterium]